MLPILLHVILYYRENFVNFIFLGYLFIFYLYIDFFLATILTLLIILLPFIIFCHLVFTFTIQFQSLIIVFIFNNFII